MKSLKERTNEQNSMMASTSAYGSDWYVGSDVGYSSLQYDVNNYIQTYIDKNGYSLYQDVLQTIGVPLSIKTNLRSMGHQYFIGRKINDAWSVEFAYRDYGTYAASAAIEATVSERNFSWSYREHQVNLQFSGSASAQGTATATATGFSTSFLYNLVQKEQTSIFLRLGAEYVRASMLTVTSYNYNYMYRLVFDESVVTADTKIYNFSEKKFKQKVGSYQYMALV